MTPPVVKVKRIIPGMAADTFEPRVQANADKAAAVVIAEIVMIVTRIGEQPELKVA